MLGKPVIVRLDPQQPAPLPASRCTLEAPAANANEHTVTDVLRRLVRNARLRADLGARARQFAIAWSSLNEWFINLFASPSNILFLAQPVENGMNDIPLLQVLFQRPLAVLLQRIVFALAPILDFDPARLD